MSEATLLEATGLHCKDGILPPDLARARRAARRRDPRRSTGVRTLLAARHWRSQGPAPGGTCPAVLASCTLLDAVAPEQAEFAQGVCLAGPLGGRRGPHGCSGSRH